MSVTVETRDDGFMVVKGPGSREALVYLPILKKKILDEPEGHSPDVLYASLKYVPQLNGMYDRFKAALSAFSHSDTSRMVLVMEYTKQNLLYGLFNPDNPGHVFVAMQCFGGWWAGVAAQIFTATLLEMCKEFKVSIEKSTGARSADTKELDMVMGVLACICKSFGCSARTPIIPHYPGGAPADPVVLLADAMCSKYPHLKGPNVREGLLRALRDWHVPRYMRSSGGDYRRTWLAQNHVDRTRAFMEMALRK